MSSKFPSVFLFVLIGLASGASAPAQQPPKPPPAPPAQKSAASAPFGPAGAASPDYSKEAVVIEQLHFQFRFENDGTGSEVQSAKVRIQGGQALENWGHLIFSYSAASDQPHIDFVRVDKRDGKVVTAGPDAIQYLSSPVERIAPVYSDLRQIHITVPDLSVGDTLEYQITTATIHPLVPGQFFLLWNAEKNAITLDDTLQVNAPRTRQLHIKTAPGIAPPEIHDSGDRRTYIWHTSFTRRPEESEKKSKASPKPEPFGVQLSTFATWEQVGEWYSSLERPRAAPTDAIRAKAAELVAGQTTDLAKARAIYQYVSRNIRYVSLSFGLGRYQPHPAAEVLANEYGDCKDEATLLESLLAAEGIESYPVLINIQRELDPDVPSPAQFNHLINIVVIGGKTYWADTTPGVAPFDYLLAPLRDKQALAIPRNAPASLVRTPENPPFLTQQRLSVEGTVDSFGRLQGQYSLSASGDIGIILRSALHIVPQNFWNKLSDALVSTVLGSRAKVSEFHFHGAEDLDQPLLFDAQFSDPNFLDLTKKDTTLALSAGGIDLPEVAQPEKGSTTPLELGVVRDQTEQWKIVLPPQLSATLPVPVHLTRDYAEYQASYTLSGHSVTIQRRLAIRDSKIPSSRYDDWMAFRAAVQADEAQLVSLANSAPGLGSIPSGLSADDLYHAARDAENARNYAQAATLFAAAAAKDPDHEGVWNNLGYCYNMLGQYDNAVGAFQKAIAHNAYDPYAYNNLGLAYQGLGRYDDAVAQFQKQIEINPLDLPAHSNLGHVYLLEKKYDLAQKEFQTALQITPQNVLLNVSLGQAELALRQDDAALQAFQKALEKSPSPVVWNNVAWAMAENGSHLDLATQYSENSIRATEAQLNAATLATISPAQAELTMALANYWDTMGWIKFKENHLASAEEYIAAAWMVDDDAAIGDHLGQIYEKEGRKKEAVHAYALALLCPHPLPETRGRLAALIGEKKVDAAIAAARPELAARRDVKIANPKKIAAAAEYWVLLTPGASPGSSRVEDAKFISLGENFHRAPVEKLNDAFHSYTDSLRAAQFPYHFPSIEPAKLLLRGVLACTDLTGDCTFTAFPAEETLRTLLAASSSAAR